jgi:hypothetical protein
VHGERGRAEHRGAPRRELGDRGLAHQLPEGGDESGVLGDLDELPRGNRAPLGMVPAHQRFDSCGPAGAQVHDELVVHDELTGRGEAAAQLLTDPHPGQGCGVHCGFVDRVAAFALRLGRVHGGVCVAEQQVRVLAADRETDPDRGGGPAGVSRHLHRVTQCVEHSLGDQEDSLRVRLDDDRELVAPQAGHGVAPADHAAQPLGHLDEQRVAHRVTEAVVDGLEAVEVEHKYRGYRGAPIHLRQGLADAVGEHGAVGQAGQWVVQGEVLELATGVLELCCAFGDPGFEVGVERAELLAEHVQTHDDRVDGVRGRRWRQAGVEAP